MKPNLLIILFLIAFTSLSHAQGIKFQKLDWEANLKKASAENKLVYIDFYTTWCGPCKYMAKKYFPNEKAGTFYNKNFFCLKVDAEKEGVALAKQYKVSGYPTNLFINPKTQEIVYKKMGAPSDLTKFINNGSIAVKEYKDPMTLEAYAKKLEGGNTSKEFTLRYLKKLTRLDRPNQKPLDAYSSRYFKKEIDSVECEFMDKYLKDINNSTHKILLNNKKAYTNFLKQKGSFSKWEDALTYMTEESVRKAAPSRNMALYEKSMSLSKELSPADFSNAYFLTQIFYKGYDSLKHIMNEYDYANKLIQAGNSFYDTKNSEGVASLMKQIEWQSKEWPAHMVAKLDSVQNVYRKNKFYSQQMTAQASSHLNSQAWHVFEGKDRSRYSQAVQWAKKAYAMAKKVERSQAAIADTYANLLFVTGNKTEAIKIEKEAIERLKVLGEDASEYEKALKSFQ